jgi:RimJ/RimL family protein N-acetyltransferase
MTAAWPPNGPEELHFEPMDATRAGEIGAWAYPPPYELYDSRPDTAATLLRPENRYHAVLDAGGGLVGFCCFGPDARVPGDSYPEPALDVGAGLRPELTGHGGGAAFLRAICAFAERELAAGALRATVAAYNERSRRACERAGFRELRRFEGPGGREFVVLLRHARG